MGIDTIAKLDSVCRICLREDQLEPIFGFDREKSELSIAEKIILCTPIVVRLSLVMRQLNFGLFNEMNIFICHFNTFIDIQRWKTSKPNLYRLFIRFGYCI